MAQSATWLDAAEEAFELGDAERVLELCDQALENAPDDLDALELRAAALAELGEYEDADDAYLALLKKNPGHLPYLLASADVLIRQPGDDKERIEEGLRLVAEIKKRAEDELRFEALLLEGVALNQLGELESALKALEQALEINPADLDARLEHALSLFELCRFDAAERELTALGELGHAHHYLGLLAERRGDPVKAERHFAKARKLAPEDFPPSVQMTEAQFDAVLKDALQRLPDYARGQLDNVTVRVKPIPSDDDLNGGELSPTILGVFSGTPLNERSLSDALAHDTAHIFLFQKNLERFARSRDELIEQIGITLLHEVGHFLGLDEDELYRRGLD